MEAERIQSTATTKVQGLIPHEYDDRRPEGKDMEDITQEPTKYHVHYTHPKGTTYGTETVDITSSLQETLTMLASRTSGLPYRDAALLGLIGDQIQRLKTVDPKSNPEINSDDEASGLDGDTANDGYDIETIHRTAEGLGFMSWCDLFTTFPIWDPSAPQPTSIFAPLSRPTVKELDRLRNFDKKERGIRKIRITSSPNVFSYNQQELPELIYIRSPHLINSLGSIVRDESLHQNSYSKSYGSSLHILRPFKILIHHSNDIREYLDDLETVRQSEMPLPPRKPKDERNKGPFNRSALIEAEIPYAGLTKIELMGLISDVRCLIDFMDTYISPVLTRNSSDAVFFSELWYTFKEGSLIYVKDNNIPQKVWKVIQRAGGRRLKGHPGRGITKDDEWLAKFSQFAIDCFCLDFDGTRYVPVFHRIFIDPFEGPQATNDLPAIPLSIAEGQNYINKKEMIDRGRNFVKYTQPTHCDYVGYNQLKNQSGKGLISEGASFRDNVTRYMEWIDSDVMVDTGRALQVIPEWRPTAIDFEAYSPEAAETESMANGYTDDDVRWDKISTKRVMSDEMEKLRQWHKGNPPTNEEDLLLLPGHVFAFVFRTRKWTCLQLGANDKGDLMLQVRTPRLDPWSELQLPSGHKRLIESLIDSHTSDNASKSLHFDLVRSKGKGVIILLHGVPGVGKTSTAECAAESSKRPLLPITCGDLGTSPKEVESKLQEAFQLAQRWKCVLLLDEADIFLAHRNANDIDRNALVSVFLRVLEYYEGILFLTTNRVGVFDEAFKSRLHMALYYPPLSWEYTKRIWETHIEKLIGSGLIDADKDEILDYAKTLFDQQSKKGSTTGPVWNGRQIRNAFQSAVALAGHKQAGKFVLSLYHFEIVSRISDDFNSYLFDIQRKTDSDRALQWGTRGDSWARHGANGSQPRLERSQSIDINHMGFGANTAMNAPGIGIPQQISMAGPMVGMLQQGLPMQHGQGQHHQQPYAQQYAQQQQQQQQQVNFQTQQQPVLQNGQANLGFQPQYAVNQNPSLAYGNQGTVQGTMGLPINANLPEGQ